MSVNGLVGGLANGLSQGLQNGAQMRNAEMERRIRAQQLQQAQQTQQNQNLADQGLTQLLQGQQGPQPPAPGQASVAPQQAMVPGAQPIQQPQQQAPQSQQSTQRPGMGQQRPQAPQQAAMPASPYSVNPAMGQQRPQAPQQAQQPQMPQQLQDPNLPPGFLAPQAMFKLLQKVPGMTPGAAILAVQGYAQITQPAQQAWQSHQDKQQTLQERHDEAVMRSQDQQASIAERASAARDSMAIRGEIDQNNHNFQLTMTQMLQDNKAKLQEARESAADRRQDKALASKNGNPDSPQAVKDRETVDQVKDLVSLGGDIQDRLKTIPQAAGLMGDVRRAGEVVGGALGIGSQDRRVLSSDLTQFGTEYQRLMGQRNLTRQDRSDLNNIIHGVDAGGNTELATRQIDSALNRLTAKYQSLLAPPQGGQGTAPAAGGNADPLGIR